MLMCSGSRMVVGSIALVTITTPEVSTARSLTGYVPRAVTDKDKLSQTSQTVILVILKHKNENVWNAKHSGQEENYR